MSERGVPDSGNFFRSMPRKMFLRMLPPSVFSALALALANVADALVVGNQVGELGLATIGLATPVYLVYSLLGVGFASGGGISHARLTANSKNDVALYHCRRHFITLLSIGALIAILGNLFPDTLLTGLGVGTDMTELRILCASYVRPLVTAAPLFFLNYLLYYFVRNDDNPGLAAAGYGAGCILDLALNILFVIVMRKGVQGAVAATIIAQAVSVAILSVHLFSGRKGILRLKAIFRTKADRWMAGAVFEESMKIGFSSSVSYLFQFLFLLLGNHLLVAAGAKGTINGELAVAVFDLVMNCSFVTVSVYQASSEAMQPLAATFSAEHDRQSLNYLLRITLRTGLVCGVILAGAIALCAGPISALFGLKGPEAQDMAVGAIRIFLLSTPIAGALTILISYEQSTDNVKTAALGTMLRSAVFLLPATLLLGLYYPAGFWWLFPAAEALSLLVLAPVLITGQKKAIRREVPVISRTITNDNRELGSIVEAVEQFCEENEVPRGTSFQLQLAVEELCAVTIDQAFSGKPGEYIRVTLVAEAEDHYVLHIRNSAPYFNPLDMQMEKARTDMNAEVMDSIGVMMVQKKAKSLHYRNYQGYNVMTVEY